MKKSADTQKRALPPLHCPYHPETEMVDAAGPPVEPLALCPECDGPLELVDVVRQLWRRVKGDGE